MTATRRPGLMGRIVTPEPSADDIIAVTVAPTKGPVSTWT